MNYIVALLVRLDHLIDDVLLYTWVVAITLVGSLSHKFLKPTKDVAFCNKPSVMQCSDLSNDIGPKDEFVFKK